jgi:hypothetical protein
MPSDSDSILNSIKKTLGIDSAYTAFDIDVAMHINTSFTILQQLGVGPVDGFAIIDDTSVWSDYTDNNVMLASVQSYVFTKVKLLFDPPPTSFGLDAMKSLVSELEWRLNIAGEQINKPSDPTTDRTSPYATSGG